MGYGKDKRLRKGHYAADCLRTPSFLLYIWLELEFSRSEPTVQTGLWNASASTRACLTCGSISAGYLTYSFTTGRQLYLPL